MAAAVAAPVRKGETALTATTTRQHDAVALRASRAPPVPIAAEVEAFVV